MGNEGDDAQRELEKRALRNVRGLVDKIEAEDAKSNQKQIVGVVLIVVLVAALLGAWMIGRGKGADKASERPAIEIPPPARPVAK